MQSDTLQPFFIFGSPRSGTSLLSRMVDSHDNLVVPNESLIFKMFAKTLSDYGDLSQRNNQENLLRDILATRVIQYWAPPAEFDDVAPLIKSPGFAGVVEALVCSRAQDKDLHGWGEKSPGHVFYWDYIKREFPNAKVIHILRDGRDVAASIIKARQGPKTYIAAAQMWIDYLDGIASIKESCSDSDFIEIRYEDLLENPESVLRQICEGLGLDYSESMLNFHKKNVNYQTDSTNSANLNKPLISSNKEKWRQTLSATDLQEFETIGGEHLEKYGYGRASQLQPLSSLKLFFLRRLMSPFIRFFSRAKDTQGQLEFLSLKRVQLKRKFANWSGNKS